MFLNLIYGSLTFMKIWSPNLKAWVSNLQAVEFQRKKSICSALKLFLLHQQSCCRYMSYVPEPFIVCPAFMDEIWLQTGYLCIISYIYRSHFIAFVRLTFNILHSPRSLKQILVSAFKLLLQFCFSYFYTSISEWLEHW